MDTYLLFLLLGLGAGGVYAILGLGLVMQYRSAGFINFSHGALAMYIAYVYVELRTAGLLTLPWVGIPNRIRLTEDGLGVPAAMGIALVYSAVFGALLYVLIFRPLRHAPALGKVVGAVGLMLALQGLAVLSFGTQPRSTSPILLQRPMSVGGLQVPSDRLLLAGLTVVLALVLGGVYKYTRFGLATRAAASNEVGASLLGFSPASIGGANWVLACVLAGLAGILIVPISSLDPTSYSLFVIPALGVALVGRFRSFGITVVGGLVLGMLQAIIPLAQRDFAWLPDQGLREGIPCLIIIISMALLAEPLAARGGAIAGQTPSVGRPRHVWATALLCLLVGGGAMFVLPSSYRSGLISSLIITCVALSIVVLTGYLGQISLTQMAFAGVGAFTLSHLTVDYGFGLPLAPVMAALIAVPLGFLIGLPALRLRSLHLAVITLAAAVTLDAMVFNNRWFSGGFDGRTVGKPELFSLDLAINGDPGAYPRVAFGLMVVVLTTGVGIVVALVRNGALGRRFLAVKNDELAAAGIGISVERTKMVGFCLSAFIAGLGGAMLAYQQTTVSPAPFTVFASLGMLAVVYVGGAGRISGAVVAGLLLAPSGLGFVFSERVLHIGSYYLLIAGIALILTAIGNPDGLASTEAGTRGPGEFLVKLGRRLRVMRRSAVAEGTAS